jgi:ATP-dependent Zn protease
MSTLLQNGCHDIVTVPESMWQRFWNGPELALALPFAYSVAFYWTIRRLRRQQLDCGGDGEAACICQRSSKSTIAATNTAATVAGVNSSVRELSDVVSYARHPDTFHSIGATLPREILLLSPLGCGKTTSCGPTRSWSMSWFYPDMSRKSSCKK